MLLPQSEFNGTYLTILLSLGPIGLTVLWRLRTNLDEALAEARYWIKAQFLSQDWRDLDGFGGRLVTRYSDSSPSGLRTTFWDDNPGVSVEDVEDLIQEAKRVSGVSRRRMAHAVWLLFLVSYLCGYFVGLYAPAVQWVFLTALLLVLLLAWALGEG